MKISKTKSGRDREIGGNLCMASTMRYKRFTEVNLRNAILFIIILFMFVPLFSEEIEDDKDDKDKQLEELRNYISESVDDLKYIKDAPKGLKSNNYVIDDKGYFWYIYEAVSGRYQIMRYNGYESEIMKTVNDNCFNNDKSYTESVFTMSQKAYLLPDGKFVFFTPQNIILYNSNEFKTYSLFRKDKIGTIFTQNDKLVVIGEKSYYVVEDDEVISVSPTIQLSDSVPKMNIIIAYEANFEENIVSKRDFLLTRNNDILFSKTRFNDCYGFYKYNSNNNFRYMEQLISIDEDYYVKLINESLVDSIFVMSKDEYNEIINPMIKPKFISDTQDNSYLYFKYTNCFHSIDPDLNEAEKIDLSQDIKIVNIFMDKEKREWVIYHNDKNLYLSDFDTFIKQGLPLHYYEFTEQESTSGGSFCLYWNENIYKFITKGTLNNQKFTSSDKRLSGKDYEEQFKLEYIRYLCGDNLTENEKFIEFNPGFEEDNFNNIYYSDNMLIKDKSNSEIKRIKEIKIYDLKNGNDFVKKIVASSYIRNIKLNRTKNLLIFFSDETQFMQLDSHLTKIELPIELNSSQVNHFANNILVANTYGTPDICRVYDYFEEKFILRSKLLNNFNKAADKSNNALILMEKNKDSIQLNRYYLETGEIDSLLSFSNKTKNIVSENAYEILLYNILLVDEDGYKLVDLTTKKAYVICEVKSQKLYPLVKDDKSVFAQITDNKLFIGTSKILYDLIEDDYETKENWITVSSTANVSYVFYKEEDNGSYIYRVSRFKNGNLIKQDSDFIHKSELEYEYIGLVCSDIGYYPIINKNIYNYNEEKWKLYSGVSDYYTYVGSDGNLIHLPLLGIKDTTHRLYVMGSEDPLVIIDYTTGLEFSYNHHHGIPDNIGALYLNNDELFISDWSGDLLKLNKSLLNPTLDISWLEVNGKRKDFSKPLTFTSTENNITIPVAILNYMYPEEYPMKYKLTGFDQDWKVGTYSGKITYENLNPGKYSFDIQAFPTDFSDMSWPTIEFRILPPWYKSWWAYTSYALFLALVIYLIFKQRVKQYKKNQEVLENKVNERTHELSETTNTLKIQTEELTSKTLELTEQQQKMRESIEYASLIQRSILPQDSELKLLFQDHFVIWKPRDIVGGDFYWLYENQEEEKAYLAVIDCTGHGVPGALLSMTVNSLLNHTIKDRGITNPAQIIAYLHKEICSLMHQKAERSVQDGFEIALVKLDFANNILTYSGAGLNIVLQEPNKELFIMKGDRYNVGGQKLYANINFTEESYNYQPKTKLFLYSDGIVDQPRSDSERIKRLGYKGWIDTLDSLQGLTMNEQAEKLNKLIVLMLNEHEQRDDITIIGVEI